MFKLLSNYSDTVAEVGTEGKMKTKTTVLKYTINTESGHCNKTLAILQNFLTQDQFQFLVIVDDDTILSVARLVQMLACFSPEAEDGSFILGKVIMSRFYNEIFKHEFIQHRPEVRLQSSHEDWLQLHHRRGWDDSD